jgi:hypothetical protein
MKQRSDVGLVIVAQFMARVGEIFLTFHGL